MKKNLLVLLAVALMLALLGAPALAAGHGGHVDTDNWVVVESSDVSFDQGTLLEFEALTAASADEEMASEDIGFHDAPDSGMQYNVLSVFGFVASADSGDVRFSVVTSVDGAVPFALSGDSQLYPLVESGGVFVAAATETLSIADGSWADDQESGPGVVDAAVILAKQVPADSDNSSGSGCSMTAIAPMAGLLLLPLLMLVKR